MLTRRFTTIGLELIKLCSNQSPVPFPVFIHSIYKKLVLTKLCICQNSF